METTKKTLLILLGILLVAGSIYGGFYLFKKILDQKEKKSEVVFLPEQPTLSIKRDLEGDIPAVFPEKLIPKEDISLVLESFNVFQNGKTQYTYRYISKKDYINTRNYFINTIQKLNNWNVVVASGNNTNLYTINATEPTGTEIFVAINKYKTDAIIVDLTLIK